MPANPDPPTVVGYLPDLTYAASATVRVAREVHRDGHTILIPACRLDLPGIDQALDILTLQRNQITSYLARRATGTTQPDGSQM